MTREEIQNWMRTLMLADHLGDVDTALRQMASTIEIALEGNFLEGWSDADWTAVGATP